MPRIRKIQGIWFCFSEVIPNIWNRFGCGDSPKMAYSNWEKACG